MNVLEGKIKEDLMIFDMEADSWEDVISQLADMLESKGYVKDTYKKGVIDREKVYPTGLLLGEYNVAIPHTEICHVNKAAIAVAKLKKPVVFKYMADPNQDVPTSLVLMMAINDPKGHVPVLAKLMEILGNPENIKKLLDTSDKTEFRKLLEDAAA